MSKPQRQYQPSALSAEPSTRCPALRSRPRRKSESRGQRRSHGADVGRCRTAAARGVGGDAGDAVVACCGCQHRCGDGRRCRGRCPVADEQGRLVCCSPWGHKDSDTNWVTELSWAGRINSSSMQLENPGPRCSSSRPFPLSTEGLVLGRQCRGNDVCQAGGFWECNPMYWKGW